MTSAISAHRKIQRYLRARRDEQVRFLAELVKVPSDNPPGDCARHAARAAELLEALGLRVERHPVPDAVCRANGIVSVTNLIVRRRFGEGPTIALNAHGDAVAPGDGWTRDPYGATLRDGRMYGRGAAVSKSDFATYAYALLALESLSESLSGTVELHFTYDEESGGAAGPKWLLETGLTKPDYVISAGFSYSVVTAHNGCLHLEVAIQGRSAHAAQPETGRDALEAAAAVLTRLYRERGRLSGIRSRVVGIDSPTLVVGLIQGGINTNVVPDRVSLRLDRRVIPEESPEQAERVLCDMIREAVEPFPDISVRVRRIMLAEPLRPLSGIERLVEPIARHASAVFGVPVGTAGVPLYTDARHYAAAGVPTVLYGAGPRTLIEANAHGADERLDLDDLRKATEVVVRSVCSVLGGDDG